MLHLLIKKNIDMGTHVPDYKKKLCTVILHNHLMLMTDFAMIIRLYTEELFFKPFVLLSAC